MRMVRGDLVWIGMSKRYEKVRCHVKNSLGVGLIAVLLVNLIVVDRVRGDWKQDWDKTVAAAEKEGEVTIYGQSRAGVGKAILAFKDVYPKIKINFIGGSGSDLAKKIMAEKRADKHLVDLSIGGRNDGVGLS
jgi:hypothetical protein